MICIKKNLAFAAALAATLAAPSAVATYGMFSHGYGMQGKGMAGARTAMTSDTFGGANNPATMVWAGNRIDVGVDWFSPIRSMSRTGATNGLNGNADSGSENFFIPEFGYNRMLGDDRSIGVTVYGNGGMNTDYPGGQITGGGSAVCNGFGVAGTGQNMLCGSGRLGINLVQLIIAPTFAVKVNPKHSVGVSALIGYQRFSAEGLQGFASLSSDSTALTNNGTDSATGFGVRVGWLGKVADNVSVGAAYSSEINMDKFDKYKGLFAEQGDLNVPKNLNVGVAVQAAPKTTVAVDFQKIYYSDVAAIGNPSTNTGQLGANNGRGFGWSDVNVWKFAVEHQYSKKMTFRGGVSRTDNPVQGRDVTFNILAPAVVQTHFTFGFTRTMNDGSELTIGAMYAPEEEVSGASLFTALGAGNTGNETIRMKQYSFGIAWGKRL